MENSMKKLIESINLFRAGQTEQSYRRDLPMTYDNEYITLARIDSANKKGGKSVLRGKQWSIIYELKKSFTSLSGWCKLKEYYQNDLKITPVTRGVLKGCNAIRLYHMSAEPTDEIILEILKFIFS